MTDTGDKRARWLRWLPLPAAAVFYGAFIAETRVEQGGRALYALMDDAMISMTYGRSLAEGDGLVWTDGEKVEGYSNFLWTLWMAVLHLLPASDRTASVLVMITSGVLLLATMWVAGRLIAELAPGRPALEAAAMLLTGLYYPLAFWSLRGMEVGLAALLVALMALLAVRLEREFTRAGALWLAATMSGAVLTRDELLMPCAIVGAFLLWRAPREARARIALLVAAPVALVLAGHLALRLAYYGEPLPNTYHLKATGIPIDVRVERGIVALAHSSIVTLYAALLMACAHLALTRRRLSRGAVLLAILVVAQAAYSVFVGGDFIEQLEFANRYLATTAPLLMVLAVLGIASLMEVRDARTRIAVALAFVAAAAIVAVEWIPTRRLGFEPDDALHVWRAAIALAIGGTILALPWVLRRLPDSGHSAGALGLTVLVLAAVSGEPGVDWARDGAQGVENDVAYARYGLALRDHTADRTRVAMVAAGNTAYFARRPGVDLLGKMDPEIARGPNRSTRFQPGHSKWNYEHSLGRLRPDVVAELWFPTDAELCAVSRWGYRQVAPGFYVRRGAPGVELDALAGDIRAIGLRPPWPEPGPGCA